MTKKLYDYAVDDNLEIYLLIKSADVRTAKNGKLYLAMTFQDQSGQMDGMYWSATDEEIEKFKAGTIVYLAGRREVFNGQPQLRITSLRPTNPQYGEPTAIADFVEHAPMSREAMEEEINRLLFEVTNPYMRRIVHKILAKYQTEFFEFPAAKRHHHAFSGGLSYHTLSMLRIANAIANQYNQVNRSLLFAGVILHDIGKTIELTGAIGTEYTLKGNMLGHIVLMDEEIGKACEELDIDQDQEEVILLKHMVLSHHGKLEYGSPVRPKLLEAEILHMIDMMDASITMITNAIEKTDPGQFSDKVYGLDSRAFYKPVTTD